jgi:hypothetical protein
VNATETFKLEFDCDWFTAWPVTEKVLCVVIKGKHEFAGLFTAVTIPERLLPFWVKFTCRVVAGGKTLP